ncbi:MAG: ABC transporter permease, partial [Anaerolineales bacterium]|nr:ABC transporter permease [Anaerolineales bacterium]
MLVYILRRIGFLGLTLVITSLLVFLISQVIPGDVCRVILGREAGEAALQDCRIELGFVDEKGQSVPAGIRYVVWLGDFIQGNWGMSFATGEEIQPWVMGRVRNSLMLGGLALVISVPLATFLGVLAGLNEGKLIDTVISVGSLSVVGLPEFITGIILINLVAFRLAFIPANSSIPV